MTKMQEKDKNVVITTFLSKTNVLLFSYHPGFWVRFSFNVNSLVGMGER